MKIYYGPATYHLLCILIAALVGFEFPSYTVNEDDGRVEICVVVSNPNVDELLAFNIITVHVTRSGTAGEDYCKINLEIGAKQFFFYRIWDRLSGFHLGFLVWGEE